jgi:uncharacterized protein YPO0396
MAVDKIGDQARIDLLRENYKNLTSAHDAIAKAEQQLARLRPLLAEAEQHSQLQGRIAEAEQCAEFAPRYFARRKLGLLEHAISAAQNDLAQHAATRATINWRSTRAARCTTGSRAI